MVASVIDAIDADVRGGPTDPPRRARTPLVALLAADGISQTGNMLTMVAVPWFVLETTGSAARTGVTAAAETLAIMVAGFLGGALVDRLGHKRTSVAGDLASAATVALIPLLSLTVGLAFWQLLVLVFLGALLDTPGWTARRSLYEVVARLGDVGLERANAGAMMVGRTAGLAGPLLAGVLIAALGPTNVLWIDAVTFLVSAGLVALAVPTRTASDGGTSPAPDGRSRSYASELLDGLRFIRSDRLVFWFMVAFALGSLLAEPIYSVVLPVYANEVFGSAVDLGVIFAGLAVGSLVGNVVFLVFAPRLPRRATIVTGFTVRVLAFWVLVSMPPVGVIAGSIAVAAIFLEPTNPIWMTIFQERVPEALRGRVFGTFLALGNAARTLGVLVYGLLLQRFGLRDTLVVLAAVNIVVPLVLWLAPALRTMGTPSASTVQRPASG
jgi:MFS family permease